MNLNEFNENRISNIYKEIRVNSDLAPRNNEENFLVIQMFSILNRLSLYQTDEFKQEVLKHVPWEKICLESSNNANVILQKDEERQDNFDPQIQCLYQLLKWFKEDFFVWFNEPTCTCSESSKDSIHSIGSVRPTVEELEWIVSTVELYICTKCKSKIRFPRYNHPLKLMHTRTGRCGEWANCFAGICNVLRYQVRLVLETNDHIWVEVWSDKEDRWIHCDPCEKAIDTPLMYEQGWKKDIAYCIAIGLNEIQDVTWRYTQNPEVVLTRRQHQCRESWLSNLIMFINKQLQTCLGPDERRQLIKRSFVELLSFVWIAGKPKTHNANTAMQGRQSGSLQWRLRRGETQQTQNQFMFELKDSLLDADQAQLSVEYDVVADQYKFGRIKLKGWNNGVWRSSHMFRKLEPDWKMVYLCRLDALPQDYKGEIEWAVDWTQLSRYWKKLSIRLVSQTFEGAQIQLHLVTDHFELPLLSNQPNLVDHESKFDRSKRFYVRATLSGGSGQMAWQHAQLFRTSLAQRCKSLQIVFIF